MADDRIRRELLFKAALEALRDWGTQVSRAQVMAEIPRRLDLTPYELAPNVRGRPRYDTHLGFLIAGAATVGWASKLGGWSITDAGIEALDEFPDPSNLNAELNRKYHEVDQRRKEAIATLSDVHAPRAPARPTSPPASPATSPKTARSSWSSSTRPTRTRTSSRATAPPPARAAR